jgi:hypothetical protein
MRDDSLPLFVLCPNCLSEFTLILLVVVCDRKVSNFQLELKCRFVEIVDLMAVVCVYFCVSFNRSRFALLSFAL